jgi:hypothetical protein
VSERAPKPGDFVFYQWGSTSPEPAIVIRVDGDVVDLRTLGSTGCIQYDAVPHRSSLGQPGDWDWWTWPDEVQP